MHRIDLIESSIKIGGIEAGTKTSVGLTSRDSPEYLVGVGNCCVFVVWCVSAPWIDKRADPMLRTGRD